VTQPDRHAAIFEALRADLLHGDLRQLDTHLAAFSALAESLGTGATDQDALARIRIEAERSRDLLSAAAGGVRAALRRLGETGAPAAVYTPDGSRQPLGPARPTSESRA
jgi:hypothetical protein